MRSQPENDPIEAILFDLDGTLLRVQMEYFIPRYVERLAAVCSMEIKPRTFIRTMLQAIRHLINETGDGRSSNEERLVARLKSDIGITDEQFRSCLEKYAEEHLDELKTLVQPIPLARRIVKDCHDRGIPMVLATNPVFPRFMIEARMLWGGLEQELFRHVTTYENSRYCKPQTGYFTDIADWLGVPPERCLMVGNDSSHDLAAGEAGMQTFLVDTWLVEREEKRFPSHYRGDHRALQLFLDQLRI